MFDSNAIIVGLEVGTSKVCAVISEVNHSGVPAVIGIGQSPSRGVRKGEIIDAALAAEDIRNAIVDAEQTADAEVRSVFLGVSGAHVGGFNNRGVHPIVSEDREIDEEDVKDVVKKAKAINIPSENHVIHVIRQHFSVDGQEGILNPVGMLGARLEANVHVVHGKFNRLQNAVRVVKGLQLEVDEVVFNGLASALAVLSSEQKELGTLVIDLGAGATEYVVYADGVVRHSGVLAIGGDHVSNDLAYGLKVPLGRAEQLKITRGSAVLTEAVRGRTFTLPSDHGLTEKSLNEEHLCRIMAMRLEEMFQLIEQDLSKSDMLNCLRGGVVLCGGGSNIPEIEKLASRIFQLSATVGKPCALGGITAALERAEFAAGMGLIKFGAFQHAKNKRDGARQRGWKTTLSQLFRRT